MEQKSIPIDLSIPTWWLVRGDFGFPDSGSDWLLINYEKKIIEGYEFFDESFVKSCAEFGFTVTHWCPRQSPVVPIYSDEIDVQEPGIVQTDQSRD
jgi:hypothetical protein